MTQLTDIVEPLKTALTDNGMDYTMSEVISGPYRHIALTDESDSEVASITLTQDTQWWVSVYDGRIDEFECRYCETDWFFDMGAAIDYCVETIQELIA